nr:hypothetical protein [uncultured Ottowia sp.]
MVCSEDTARHSVKRQWVECRSVVGSTAVKWTDLSQHMRILIVSDMANWARHSAYGKPTH